MQQQQGTGGAQLGSQVITREERDGEPEAGPSNARTTSEAGSVSSGVLRLRGAGRGDGPRVQWGNDVVDNEHLGKKKSKSVSSDLVGCIGLDWTNECASLLHLPQTESVR